MQPIAAPYTRSDHSVASSCIVLPRIIRSERQRLMAPRRRTRSAIVRPRSVVSLFSPCRSVSWPAFLMSTMPAPDPHAFTFSRLQRITRRSPLKYAWVVAQLAAIIALAPTWALQTLVVGPPRPSWSLSVALRVRALRWISSILVTTGLPVGRCLSDDPKPGSMRRTTLLRSSPFDMSRLRRGFAYEMAKLANGACGGCEPADCRSQVDERPVIRLHARSERPACRRRQADHPIRSRRCIPRGRRDGAPHWSV